MSEIQKNFIKPLPDGEDAAVDESLLWYQLRTRKGTPWEMLLRGLINDPMKIKQAYDSLHRKVKDDENDK